MSRNRITDILTHHYQHPETRERFIWLYRDDAEGRYALTTSLGHLAANPKVTFDMGDAAFVSSEVILERQMKEGG